MSDPFDPNDPTQPLPPLAQEQVLPTGPAVLAVINENITDNLANGFSPNVSLPSLWRLAHQVVNETAPLVFYRYSRTS